MFKKGFKNLIYLGWALCLMNCSGSGGPAQSTGVSGAVSLVVVSSKNRDSKVLAGKISHILIVVSGDGFDPIQKDLSADAHEVEISGVTPGSNRKISITAFNQDDQAVREGIAENISIAPGETKEVTIQLQAIPLFVNVRDGNVVTSKRTVFEILADPGEALTVEESLTSNNFQSLVSLSSNSNQISADASSGLGYFNPRELSLGEGVFRAKSLVTGKTSSVRLIVVDGDLKKPAPLFSAGQAVVQNNHLKPSRAGQFSASKTASPSDHIGELWPNILKQELHKKGDSL